MAKITKNIGYGILVGIFLVTVGCAAVKPEVTEAPEERLWTPSEVSMQLGDVDPWEGFNRSMFAVSSFGARYVVRPVGWVYTSIFPREVIKRIGMVSRNLEFPARLFSGLGQGEFTGSGVVLGRFLTNSTIGIAGIFDPADAWFGMYPRNYMFEQALESWGCGSGYTLMFPMSTATNVRDLVGAGVDKMLDIKTYMPYGTSSFAGMNDAVKSYRAYNQLLLANLDPYQLFKEFDVINRRLEQKHWAHKMRELSENMAQANLEIPESIAKERPQNISGKIVHLEDFYPENAYADSVRTVMFKPQHDRESIWMQLSLWNTDFTEAMERREIPALNPDADPMEFYFWRSPLKEKYNGAPLVVIVPGIGSHYSNLTSMAFAELLNKQGYAVAVLSNAFCWNFYQSRHTGKLPGYTPDDAFMAQKAIVSMLNELARPGDVDKRFIPETTNLVGYSLGGLHSLFIAQNLDKTPGLKLNKIVAINPPVDMIYALTQVDKCLDITKGWSEEKILEVVPDGFGKAMIAMGATRPYIDPVKPIDGVEYIHKEPIMGLAYRTHLSEEQAKVLIALNFRYTLRDVMELAIRENRIVTPWSGEYKWSNRTWLYRNIDKLNFRSYMTDYLLPNMEGKKNTETSLRANSGLRAIEDTLRNNPNIHVLHNLNDFLISEDDKVFLDKTLGDKITWFDEGGHLGNLYFGALHRELLEALKR